MTHATAAPSPRARPAPPTSPPQPTSTHFTRRRPRSCLHRSVRQRWEAASPTWAACCQAARAGGRLSRLAVPPGLAVRSGRPGAARAYVRISNRHPACCRSSRVCESMHRQRFGPCVWAGCAAGAAGGRPCGSCGHGRARHAHYHRQLTSRQCNGTRACLRRPRVADALGPGGGGGGRALGARRRGRLGHARRVRQHLRRRAGQAAGGAQAPARDAAERSLKHVRQAGAPMLRSKSVQCPPYPHIPLHPVCRTLALGLPSACAV